MISLERFATKRDQVAPVIYGAEPHLTTDDGVVIGPEVVNGIREFLRQYNQLVKAPPHPYYRIDAYFSKGERGDALDILEVNAAFVDGWGTALNLARASDIHLNRDLLRFPKSFVSLDSVYLPELRLFVSELEHLGIGGNTICESLSELGADESAYVYGRFGGRGQIHYPMDGVRIDNKMNLARFSQQWDPQRASKIRIPKHFVGCDGLSIEPTLWDDIAKVQRNGFPFEAGPLNVVLKFCDKGGPECAKYRKSVIVGIPEGKNKYLRKCYECGTVIAQEYIQPQKFQSDNCQLVILAIGDEPVTGYVQYSPKNIINDNSVHGPLALIG